MKTHKSECSTQRSTRKQTTSNQSALISSKVCHSQAITNFNDLVANIVDVLALYSQRIEDEKLRAVGIRNRIDNEEENRKRRQQELEIQINEKKVELDRLHNQCESLLKVETEQRLFIEKFRNNEI